MKAGDVVVLKSGGPKMTVEQVTSAQVHTVWFVGDTLHRSTIALELVDLVPPGWRDRPPPTSLPGGGE